MNNILKCLKRSICLCILLIGCLAMGVVADDNLGSEDGNATAVSALGTASTSTQYHKLTSPSGVAAGLEISSSGFSSGNAVYVTLCDSNKNALSPEFKLSASKLTCKFYIRKTDTYYIKSRTSAGKIMLKKRFGNIIRESGSSFEKAVTIPEGGSKKDVLGYETSTSTKQYYKISVASQKLVKVSFRKAGSTGKYDTINIRIYKSTDKKNPVNVGQLFEDQGSAYMYIQNTVSGQTAPGTYYIVVNKINAPSGFSYRVMYY